VHALIPHTDPIKFLIPLPGGMTIPIHGFGLLVAIGFLLGSYLAGRKALRDGLDPEIFNRLLGWVVVGVFVGGHLGHALFYQPAYYFAHPIEFLKVWSGLSSYGGFLVSGIITAIFLKKYKVPFWPSADVVLFGTVFGWIFGRMGCFSAHDHPGLQTNFWLAVNGICPDGGPTVACHDLGGYEALYTMALAAFLVWADRKPRFQGFHVISVFASYGLFRFFLDFLRHQGPDGDARYFGLTPAQYGSIGLVILASVFWARLHKTTPWRVLQEQDRAKPEPGSQKPESSAPKPEGEIIQKLRAMQARFPGKLRVLESERSLLPVDASATGGEPTLFAPTDAKLATHVEALLSEGKEVAVTTFGPNQVAVMAAKVLFRKA